MAIHVNDNVVLKGTPQEDLWEVVDISPREPVYVTIKGLTNRLITVISENQVEKVDEAKAKRILEKSMIKDKAFLTTVSKNIRPEQTTDSTTIAVSKIPGTILHLDSDKNFLQQCLDFYKGKNIISYGYAMDPTEMPGRISELLSTHNPDIVIITGHDGFIKKDAPYSMDSYVFSKHYVDAVKQARRFDRNKDNLVIFAGACQSFYEAIMVAGANFASSPKRVSIHTYDPAVIAAETALTPILSRVCPGEVIPKAESTFDEIGGIDTKGTLRDGIPFNMRCDYRSTDDFEDEFEYCTGCPCLSCPQGGYDDYYYFTPEDSRQRTWYDICIQSKIKQGMSPAAAKKDCDMIAKYSLVNKPTLPVPNFYTNQLSKIIDQNACFYNCYNQKGLSYEFCWNKCYGRE